MNPVLLAYCQNDSVRPGATVDFKVSCTGTISYRADIVRLLCCETAPHPPGFREEVVVSTVSGDYPARRQKIPIGSYARVPGPGPFNRLSSLTAQAMIWPTRPGRGTQAIMGTWSQAQLSGFSLYLDENGALAFRLGDGEASQTFSTGVRLTSRRWYLVAASFDAASGRVILHQELQRDKRFPDQSSIAVEEIASCRLSAGTDALLFAAWHQEERGGEVCVGGHFDGKIERPRLSDRVLGRAEIDALGGVELPAALQAALVGAWDFSRDIRSDRISDISANELDGKTVNLPLRGATGVNWTGREWAWRHAPEQYGAIHFHADDLYDAGWEADFSFRVPEEMPSAIYAARLRAGESEFYVPFYVRAPVNRTTAEVLFLVPSATYMAYANPVWRVTSPVTDRNIGKLTVVDETDLLMLEYPEIGLSAYDAHRDGSSVCYSSRLRPITNHRPNDSDITSAWNNFAADLLIIDWLDHLGIACDVISDEDLHHEGLQALVDYRVVVTGTHPEYTSREMLDALDGYLQGGGRLMYMGGNGFYWRIAFRTDAPGVIELRRAQVNISRWNPGPGQYFDSFTGDPGGLWRDLGRPPQALVGVGMISQGFDSSSHYRRTPASYDPRVAFMFDGIADEIIGDFGLLRGGAAGIEIDRFDARLGSPRHALVVASSENHTNVYEVMEEAFEDVLPMGGADAPEGPTIHADIVFFECPGGGAVFSTGSIAYAGSLSHQDYNNNIARLTENVLRRFLDATPFEMP